MATTTRQVTVLLTRYLGVEVAPYTARLVRDGVLPRSGEPIDEREVAILLLAVAAASDPGRAIDALNTLASATAEPVERSSIPCTDPRPQTWRAVTDEGFAWVMSGIVELVAAAVQGDISINWLSIDDGGRAGLIVFDVGGDPSVYRAEFFHMGRPRGELMMRSAYISGSVIARLADAMNPERRFPWTRPRAFLHPASLELH
ncbi:MAG: hypothetical protein IIA01_00230 [Proteobacteria bacterium]|nr:hypothetical protein [Pseudomonadota bacterium]